LSLRELAVLLRNRVDQIGIGDKETRKNNKKLEPTIKERSLARLEHAVVCTHEALRIIKAFLAMSIFSN
jgi:hypothetical protein